MYIDTVGTTNFQGKIFSSKTNKKIKKFLNNNAVVLTTCAICVYAFFDAIHQRNNEARERTAKMELLKAKETEYSIKMDSIAKANYALGMQAVRDSLANANKE